MPLTAEELRIAKKFGLCAKEAEAMKADASENAQQTFETPHSVALKRILTERDNDFEAPKTHQRFDHS